jgi:NAD-dependent DNA ligase
MKAIDELIEKYFDKDKSLLSDEMCDEILKDLEQLKAELKEQHKKDVVTAVKYGIFITKSGTKTEVADKESEQYYNQNH